MALGSKKQRKIYEKTTTSDPFFITGSKQLEMSRSFAAGAHIKNPLFFENGGSAVIYQIKEMQEDIEELRRFGTGSGEINVDGGSF